MAKGDDKAVSCECQGCGKQYKVDLVVSNELWEQIEPNGKPVGAGLLCAKCIGERIEQLDVYAAYKLVGD